jgi:hypothetical protein
MGAKKRPPNQRGAQDRSPHLGLALGRETPTKGFGQSPQATFSRAICAGMPKARTTSRVSWGRFSV